jgi:hypothetical protein
VSLKRGYKLRVGLVGQVATLTVDGVHVLTAALPRPLLGSGVGLVAWGAPTVRFDDFAIDAAKPQAFVVMQFGEPFDSLYTEVIWEVASAHGFDVMRADEVFAPGLILQDVTRLIEESTVVIADISSLNPNVFYELGWAQARGKPTILLAERDTKLPFDVSGFRVVLYDNTIAGKRALEVSLNKNLGTIIGSD